MVNNVDKLSKSYMKQGLFLTVALALLTLLVMQVWQFDLLVEIIVSVVFSLVVCWTIGLVWRWVAKNHQESLPTFFTAVSGFRLLLALAVMFVYYLVCGRGAMLHFFLVFMVFYFASLIHHSIFFAKVSNRS